MTATLDHATQLRIGNMISEFAVPGVIPLSKKVGLHFSILDAEHGSFGLETIATLAAVARGHSYELLVRVPVIEKAYIGPTLDAGVAGIVAPMVETAEQASELIRLARYTPLGERGISLTRAHSDYGVSDVPGYLETANSRVQVYAQIETTIGVRNLAEIASVEGLSGLVVGPNDLLVSLGTPGQYANPQLLSAIESVASTCAEHDLTSGIITAKDSLLVHAVSCGMTFVSIDSDLGYFIKGARQSLDGFAAALEGV